MGEKTLSGRFDQMFWKDFLPKFPTTGNNCYHFFSSRASVPHFVGPSVFTIFYIQCRTFFSSSLECFPTIFLWVLFAHYGWCGGGGGFMPPILELLWIPLGKSNRKGLDFQYFVIKLHLEHVWAKSEHCRVNDSHFRKGPPLFPFKLCRRSVALSKNCWF